MIKNLKNNQISKTIFKKAQSTDSRIILPENDMRISKAKKILIENHFNIIDLNTKNISKYIDYISKFKFTQNWTKDMMTKYLENSINLSCAMLACNDADGVVAGAVTSTSEIIRSAIRLIGIDEKVKWVSSMFLMISPDNNDIYAFSDCAVIPEPNIEQLVTIAYQASELYNILTGNKPKVAFLSFSTNGSASHYRVDRIRDASIKFMKKYPKILCDGEIQLDAAIVPEISIRKTINSNINGQANVLIFPNLDAGNIGYKIAQRMGNYIAWGPLLQGFKKPIHDLSRGCSIDDIINIVSITAVQSKYYANI